MIQNLQMSTGASALPWPVLWAPVFSAFGVVCVGIFAGYIAYRQWRTANTKMQLDLYAARLPVLEATQVFMVKAVNLQLDNAAIDTFQGYRMKSRLLYDEFIFDYLGTVDRVGQLIHMSEFRQKANLSPEVAAMLGDDIKIQIDSRNWLAGQYESLADIFEPYLQFEAKRTRVGKHIAMIPPPPGSLGIERPAHHPRGYGL